MKRPEPLGEVVAAIDPIKSLLSRLQDEVIPLIEKQREPSQRKALLAAMEDDLKEVFKVLGELESESRALRKLCAGIRRTARKLRPRGGKPRRQGKPPTQVEKQAVREALQERREAGMSELCYATGLIMFRVKRALQEYELEGNVERSGERAGTRYRWTGVGSAG